MGYIKETWMQLSDQEKCDILNSYKGKTSKWKEDNPDFSWSSATKNTNYWKDKNEKFNPGLTPDGNTNENQSNHPITFTMEEIEYLKYICEHKCTGKSEQNMTLRGINKKDVKSATLKISRELYDKLIAWVDSEDNEYGFTQHEIISILIRNFMECKVVEKMPEKTEKKPSKKTSKKKVVLEENLSEDLDDDTDDEIVRVNFFK